MSKFIINDNLYFMSKGNQTLIVTDKTELLIDCSFEKFKNIYLNLDKVKGDSLYSQFKPSGELMSKYRNKVIGKWWMLRLIFKWS